MEKIKKYPKFAAKLRQLRKVTGMTQDELADRITKSQKAVGSWEEGRARPNHPVLLTMANLFGVDVSVFYTDQDAELIIPPAPTQQNSVGDWKEKYLELLIEKTAKAAATEAASQMSNFYVLKERYAADQSIHVSFREFVIEHLAKLGRGSVQELHAGLGIAAAKRLKKTGIPTGAGT